jgi:hypothetical protein
VHEAGDGLIAGGRQLSRRRAAASGSVMGAHGCSARSRARRTKRRTGVSQLGARGGTPGSVESWLTGPGDGPTLGDE